MKHNLNQKNGASAIRRMLLLTFYWKIGEFSMAGVIALLILIGKTLSSHMKQLSENINTTKYRIQYFDQTSKMIVHLGDKKGVSNY